jgi:hypothetical protein
MTTPSSHSGAPSERARLTTSGSSTRQRSVVVGVRWTEDEAARLRADAAARGLSVPELLRAAYLAVTAIETTQEATRG